MRIFGILFLFCVSIGTVSSFSLGNIQWPSWLTSIFNKPLEKARNEVCTYLAANPNRTLTSINTIKNTLQKTNETANTFALTINYLDSTANQQNLVGGIATCKTFFDGLVTVIKTDFTNKQSSAAQAQEKALKAFTDMLNELKKICN